jgi:hypothetical protein
MPEDLYCARTINMLINQTWESMAAGNREDARPLAKHLEFIINQYEQRGLTTLPPTTLWLAHEIVSSISELCR